MSGSRISSIESRTSNLERRSSNVEAKGNGSFEGELQAHILKQAQVKLSAHAAMRFAERNVTLADSQQQRLGAAMDRIQEKGADKSLVLLDDLALVVSARNRVVITALDSQSAKDAVFTNIDSAVIG
jgi:flagellar operon protein